MTQEISRDAFLNMVCDRLPATAGNSAVHFFIPLEWLHDRKISADQVDQMVDEGRTILNTLPGGVFARIGWSSFFCLVDATREEVESALDREGSARRDQGRSLWRFATAEIGHESPAKVFSELEWRSLKSVRPSDTGREIEMRIDGQVDIDTRGRFSADIRAVGGGAGTVVGVSGLPLDLPALRYRPNRAPVRVLPDGAEQVLGPDDPRSW